MEYVKLETLFLNPEKILFISETEIPDIEHCWSEFEFITTEIKAHAWLTFNYKDQTWSGRIQTAQGNDGYDDDPEPAEPDQLSVLLGKLPEEEFAKIGKYSAEFRERSDVVCQPIY